MPLKPLSFRDVKRKLEAAGFVEISQKGSHVKFMKEIAPGRRRTAIVPRKREIRLGTLRSILRQAGLSVDEFEAL
jgi:predicted RNA binding protein YcfA (HicA-like mRNA interferase family)